MCKIQLGCVGQIQSCGFFPPLAGAKEGNSPVNPPPPPFFLGGGGDSTGGECGGGRGVGSSSTDTVVGKAEVPRDSGPAVVGLMTN